MSTAQSVFAQFLLTALAVVAVLLLAGYLPSRRLAGDSGVVAMMAGTAVSFVASLAGTLPVLGARRRVGVEVVSSALAAMAVRVAVAAGLGIAVAMTGLIAAKPLLLWVAIAHAGLLIPDTALSVRILAERAMAEDR